MNTLGFYQAGMGLLLFCEQAEGLGVFASIKCIHILEQTSWSFYANSKCTVQQVCMHLCM